MKNSIATYPEQPRAPRRGLNPLLLLVVFLSPLFLCGGLASAYYFYDTIREYVAHVNLPDYGSVVSPVNEAGANVAPVVPPPNLAAGDRINILLLGIDKREGEVGPFRTDTMIVATLDPKTKAAGMLSIPRDLYVPIPYPGLDQNRINTANFFGDLYKYPGGGPALAKKTVEYNLGIPIHFYVLIDFSGFKKIVDTLGGIDIDVPYPIDDYAYPTDDYRTEVVHIPAGHIHMNGDLALKYARSRHSTSDFDRSKRQMQIIKAIRDKALKADVLPRLPQLYSQFRDTIQTDLSLQQILAMAPVASQVKSDDIKVRAIDQSVTYEIILNNGADVLWPERSKIASLVNEMFPAPDTGSNDIAPRQENARIVVLNGTTKPGYAQQAAKYLQDHGFTVVSIGNADRSDYRQTVVTDDGQNPQTLSAVVRAFSVLPANVLKMTGAPGSVDMEIIIGADWAPPS